MEVKRPGIGLGIIVLKDDKILIGRRKDCNLYGIPGGYLEMFESWQKGASRELKEETDLNIDEKDIKVLKIYNALNKEKNYHNIAIILLAEFPKEQEVKNMEPHKCDGWDWWDLKSFISRKEDVFFPNKLLIEEYPELLKMENLRSVLEKESVDKLNFFGSKA